MEFYKRSTNIPDSIVDVLDKHKRGQHYKKALVVISDGITGFHCTTKGQFRTEIRESGVVIYGILLQAGPLEEVEEELKPGIAVRRRAMFAGRPTPTPSLVEQMRPSFSSKTRRITRTTPLWTTRTTSDTCPRADYYTPDQIFWYPSDMMATLTGESGGKTYGLDVTQAIGDWTARD